MKHYAEGDDSVSYIVTSHGKRHDVQKVKYDVQDNHHLNEKVLAHGYDVIPISGEIVAYDSGPEYFFVMAYLVCGVDSYVSIYDFEEVNITHVDEEAVTKTTVKFKSVGMDTSDSIGGLHTPSLPKCSEHGLRKLEGVGCPICNRHD